jgi:RNA polymerase sigma-70 factor (ECF subfamily)
MWTISGGFGLRHGVFASEIGEHTGGVFNGSDATPADSKKVIELYGTLQSPLRAYLGTFCLSADEVDDAIQEVFVRLIRHLHGARAGQAWDENHRGWLFRVAHNFVMDIYRDSQRMPRLGDYDAEFHLSHRADPALDPEQALLRKERLTRLDAAMRKLDIEQRSCLLLRAKGLGHKEIGYELGISAQQAAKLLQQGLGLLAGELRT